MVLRVSSESMERKGKLVQGATYLYFAPYMGDVSLPLHELGLLEAEHPRPGLLNHSAPTSVDSPPCKQNLLTVRSLLGPPNQPPRQQG